MTSDQPAKRLTYIVNRVSADDSQHYVHIPHLLSHMEQLGWTIDLVSERGGPGRTEIKGRPVTFLSQEGRWGRLIPMLSHLVKMRLRGGRLTFVRISKSAALVSAVAGRVLGWKTVYWLSDVKEDIDKRKRWGRIRFLGMWILMRLINRLATGPETMTAYYRAVYRLPAKKIILLYNDLDTRIALQAMPGRESGEPTILLVHRLSPARETVRYLPVLLDALRVAQFPASLHIVGDGPERAALERIVSIQQNSPVTVSFHGALPHHQLEEYYSKATMFIMPSYREGFPRVIIEAMAYGLPIVSTDAGGTADLVGQLQRKYIFNRDDFTGFARGVVDLLKSPQLRQQISDENLTHVQRFSTPVVARMYDQTLGEVIGAPASPQPNGLRDRIHLAILGIVAASTLFKVE